MIRIEDAKPGRKYRGYANGRVVTTITDGAQLLELADNGYFNTLRWMEVPGQDVPSGVELAQAPAAKKTPAKSSKIANADDRNIEEAGPLDGPDQRGAGGTPQ